MLDERTTLGYLLAGGLGLGGGALTLASGFGAAVVMLGLAFLLPVVPCAIARTQILRVGLTTSIAMHGMILCGIGLSRLADGQVFLVFGLATTITLAVSGVIRWGKAQARQG